MNSHGAQVVAEEVSHKVLVVFRINPRCAEVRIYIVFGQVQRLNCLQCLNVAFEHGIMTRRFLSLCKFLTNVAAQIFLRKLMQIRQRVAVNQIAQIAFKLRFALAR